MGAGSAEGEQLVPQVVDLGAEMVEIAAVVDHVRGTSQTVVTTDLARDPVAGVCLVHPTRRDEALDGEVDGHVDDDRRGQVVARVLAEERVIEHDDVVGAGLASMRRRISSWIAGWVIEFRSASACFASGVSPKTTAATAARSSDPSSRRI